MASCSGENFAKLVKKNPLFNKILKNKGLKKTLKLLKKCITLKCYNFNQFRREEKAYKKALNKTCKQSNNKQSNSKHADIFEEMKAYKTCQKKFDKTSKFPVKNIKYKKCIDKNCKEDEKKYIEALTGAVQNNPIN